MHDSALNYCEEILKNQEFDKNHIFFEEIQ